MPAYLLSLPPGKTYEIALTPCLYFFGYAQGIVCFTQAETGAGVEYELKSALF
jgi:hypothetical protein